jgi:FMN phosphatase YigB (HAD superfamily)
MDDAFENIQTAQDLGMTTVWWSKEQGKEKSLSQFLQLINYK